MPATGRASILGAHSMTMVQSLAETLAKPLAKPLAKTPVKTGLIALAALAISNVAEAGDGKSYVSKKPFGEIRFELGNAVIARGFAVQSEGNIAKMLERTAADVGASKTIYKSGEFIAFCSAKYTRMMLEANPADFANCPFLVYAYETVDKPGDVVIGYRGLGPPKSEASAKAFTEIEKILDELVTEAIK